MEPRQQQAPSNRVSVLAQHLTAADSRQHVCLVIGAGAGIGATLGKKFAAGGFTAVLVRRSGKAGLDAAVKDIEAHGGRAEGVIMDASTPGTIEALITRVEAEVGPIQVLCYNLGAQIGDRPLDTVSFKAFELGWRLGCEGLFRAAKTVAPKMIARGSGAILVTSATAAVRGNAGQHSHAAAMGGRRMLCQTLNAELGPQGVHVCHLLVDGMVNAPDTLGKMVGKEVFEQLNAQEDAMIQPKEIAELYWLVAHQPRSTWTFEMDVRSFKDTAWWNHA